MAYGTLFAGMLDLIGDYVPWVVLATARPFGFTLLFAIFAWAKLDSGILRMSYALGIALPLLASGIPSYGVEDLAMPYMTVVVKEIFIGGVLGLVSSVPLAIALAGGGIIDFYRGTFMGDPDPSGGQSTPYGSLFAVITLWLFASVGGFQIITATIYQSYDLWAVNATFPQFNPGADAILSLLQKILLSAIVLSGPLLIIMFISDIVHLISTKFGKQINVSHLAFSTKNLLAAVILPFFLVTVIQFFKGELEFLLGVNDLVLNFFK